MGFLVSLVTIFLLSIMVSLIFELEKNKFDLRK